MECADGACLTYLHRPSPGYPRNLVNDLVSGTVYLAIEVDRQGKVAQVAVRQVDLRRIADVTALHRWRDELGRASVAAEKRWTFQVPRAGLAAGREHWIVTVPVNYIISTPGHRQVIGRPAYGQWDTYVPGPVHQVPWADAGRVAANGGADAVPDTGGPFVADTRFVLLTPLGEAGAANPGPQGTPGQG
ncbi:MAG: hypothetical protein ACREP0_11520 [Rhodanobacteraceae bacterium]